MKKLLLIVCLVGVLLALAGCTDAMAKKIFMYGFEKAIGGNPDPIELDQINVSLTISLTVGKIPLYATSPFEPAYPQKLDVIFYLEHNDEVFGRQRVEKWANKEGKLSASASFARVHPQDVISIVYEPALFADTYRHPGDGTYQPGWKLTGWRADYAKILALAAGQTDLAGGPKTVVRYDEAKKIYYVTIEDTGRLGTSTKMPTW